MSRRSVLLLPLVALVFLSAACDLDLGDPEEPAAARSPAVDFRACQITDAGGPDDDSYNQAIHRGLQRAALYLGIGLSDREAGETEDLSREVETLALRECNVIVIPDTFPGAVDAARAEPEIDFVVVDVDSRKGIARESQSGNSAPENVLQVTFRTEEAALLAGYVAASTSEGTIGTYFLRDAHSRDAWIANFELGAKEYDRAHDTEIELIRGEAVPAEDPSTGRSVAASLFSRGADVVFPVLGESAAGVVTAAEDAGASLVGAVEDGCVVLPESCGLFLTSAIDDVDAAVFDAVKASLADAFGGGTYEGTLANGGVGLTRFRAFSGDVSPEVRQELNELRRRIVANEIGIQTLDD